MPVPKLNAKTLRELVEILSPHCQTPAQRRALFTLALGQHVVLDGVDYEQEVSVFLPNALVHLHEVGEIEPGKPAVVLILSVIRERVGADIQMRIDALASLISPTAPPDPMLEKLDEAEALEAWGAVIALGETILRRDTARADIQDRLAEAYFWRAAEVINTDRRPQQTDVKRALADLDRAIDLQPMRAEYYRLRGAAYFWLGNLSEAISDQTTAITLEPTNAGYFQNRGASYFERGEYARALIDCNRALDLDAAQPDFYLSRGRVHQKMGNPDAARADYEQAVALGSAVALAALRSLG